MKNWSSAIVSAAATLAYVGSAAVGCATLFGGLAIGHDDPWIFAAFASIPAFFASAAYQLTMEMGRPRWRSLVAYLGVLMMISVGIATFSILVPGAEREAAELTWILAGIALGAGLIGMAGQQIVSRGPLAKFGCLLAIPFLVALVLALR